MLREKQRCALIDIPCMLTAAADEDEEGLDGFEADFICDATQGGAIASTPAAARCGIPWLLLFTIAPSRSWGAWQITCAELS